MKKYLWFAGLWAGSVVALGVTALLLKLVIKSL